MADKRSAKKRPSAAGAEGFSAEEKAALKERAREVKAARGGGVQADGTADVLAKIAEMEATDRAMAERVHALITGAAPSLEPRTWYGMPAYARGKDVICHFQPARKFKTRYATLGFSDKARLDEGAMWPNAFALKELTPEVEASIVELVKRALR